MILREMIPKICLRRDNLKIKTKKPKNLQGKNKQHSKLIKMTENTMKNSKKKIIKNVSLTSKRRKSRSQRRLVSINHINLIKNTRSMERTRKNIKDDIFIYFIY
jgi:acetyl-CoA carboxylase alpha subunit